MRNYYPKYLDKLVYKRTLSVAQSYPNDKKCIKLIEADMIHSTPVHGNGCSSSISKPVQNTVEQIEKHTRLLRCRTNAVDKTLDKFPQHERNFIMQNIICNVPIKECYTRDCERTCQSIRHDFLVYLAEELGEIL